MSTNHYDPAEEIDEIVQNSIAQNQNAKANAAQAQERSNQQTETGAPVEDSTAVVQNKMRGGATGTELALKILGAGQPYSPGSY